MTPLSAFPSVLNHNPVAKHGVHYVPLLRLPDAFQFPKALHDRIWFDDERKCLAFRGFMSKATYDRLDALANDVAYQRAIDELFRQSVYDEPGSRQPALYKLLPIAALLTAALIAVAVSIPLHLLAWR
ncbi:MAG: hypothetical protein ABI619_11575 [Betaproteobacteria bacterium]